MRLRTLACLTALTNLLTGWGASEEIPLNGVWRFAYTPSLKPAEVVEHTTVTVMVEPNPQMPTDEQFALAMQVPGYWDDQLPYIPEAPWGNAVVYETAGAYPILFPYKQTGRPRHPDAGRPYVKGVGWHKRTIDVPEGWRGKTVMLHIGGARIATYLFVNGFYVDMHLGHGIPFEFDITDSLHYGETNEIVLGVSNLTDYINSCALRGYAGLSGGITGDVYLRVSDGPGRIVSYYVYPEQQRQTLRWKVELTTPSGLSDETRMSWNIKTLEGESIQSGEMPVRSLHADEVVTVDWDCPSRGMREWSIWDPYLHQIEVRWERANGVVIDSAKRRYGLRQLEQKDGRLFLNGRPIMLRGVCDICFYPPDIHPPNDEAFFRKWLGRLKEVGFNYIRFHTWVPSEPYMAAADEIGMLLTPEHSSHRNLQQDTRWAEMVRWTRYHPSVVIYSGGNEETAHEGLIARFAQRYREAKALAPDILILPMHTMSGPESIPGRADLPMPKYFHDEDAYYGTLWKRITRYADVFAVRANDFSYANFSGRDWRELEPEYAQYERPILAHEVGIIGTYLDLSLESRYTGSLPADLYKAAREYLEKTGRAAMAKTYFENSARWHGQARKFVLENLRKTPSMDGYDLLGGIDSHWHNSGYGCGLLNEFLEFKPGDTLERVLQYNGESVVLLDHAKRFVFRAGDHFDAPILVSLFGGKDLENGTLNWQVCEGDTVHVQGELRNLSAHDGCVTTLGSVQFTWPRLDSSKHLVLKVKLTDPTYQLTNQWDFWVFCEHTPAPTHAEADAEALTLLGERYSDIRPIGTNPPCKLRIVRSLTEPDLEYLASGGDILLLGTKPFPANETRFLMGVAGRAHMNLATVIRSHPAFKYLPHDGWCDWQFKDLLDYGACIEFSKLPVTFDPLIEVVSSYKFIRLQASMWEARTEGGRILGVSFHFDLKDPAAQALLDGIFEYMQSDSFSPTVQMSIDGVIRPLLNGVAFTGIKNNDGNFYAGMNPF